MIVVSDTSPINYLVLIGQIGVLKELFGRVIIPQAVFDEFHHPGTPEIVRKWADSAPAWLDIGRVSSPLTSSVGKLGKGEREAIALAKELGSEAILMDDRKGAKEAQKNGLVVVGTLAILEKASQKDLLELRDTLERLGKTNFRFPPAKNVQEMLRRGEEAAQQRQKR